MAANRFVGARNPSLVRASMNNMKKLTEFLEKELKEMEGASRAKSV